MSENIKKMGSYLSRWSGLVTILAGMLWSVSFFWWLLSKTDSPEAVFFIILAISAVGFGVGLATLYPSEKVGSIGKIGIVIELIGTAIFSLNMFAAIGLRLTPLFLFAILGVWVTFIGLAVFGISNLRDQVFSCWNSIPLILSVLFISSWTIDSVSLPVVLPANTWKFLGAMYGIGWGLLGFRLWTERNAIDLQFATKEAG